jgi:glycosyltransferase involved in cell wall biosynthesis
VYIFGFLKNKSIVDVQSSHKNVSIVVCSKNNWHGLSQLIPNLINQNYENFEIVVVDDFSTDQTIENIKKINNPKVKVVKANLDLPGKKHALTCGIESAKYDWILLTDSDCLPSSEEWVKTMMQYSSNADVVLGFGPYFKEYCLLNDFIRYETILTALQYMSFAQWGLSYMGVGRNMLYKKSMFIAQNGFKSHQDIASGDDDLFIQNLPKSTKFAVAIAPQSFVYSNAKRNLKEYIAQKKRHISTSTAYTLWIKTHLTLLSMARIMPWICVLSSLFCGSMTMLYSMLFLSLYFLLTANSIQKAFQNFDHHDLQYKRIYLDFFLAMYYIFLVPFLSIKDNKWN